MDTIAALKREAVESADDLLAKACWCLEQIAGAQKHFEDGFAMARRDDFYGFWCQLEQCELALAFLRRHYVPEADDFGLRHMSLHVLQFQELFPYKLFISPGMVVEEAVCSICLDRIKLRGGCEHVLGEIYSGEMCSQVIRKGRLLEASLVENPVQKYSVLFGPEITYDYGAVRYVVAGLGSAWDGWSYRKRTILEAQDSFAETGRNEPCPCGSGRKYKRCCQTSKPERVHYDVHFDKGPRPGLPTYVRHANYPVTGEPQVMTGRPPSDAPQ
jgi:hypothetical protein